MTPNGIEFAKKVGIVSTATLAGFGVLTVLWSITVASLIAPVIEKSVSGEREARVRADSALAARLSSLSHDRVILLAVLGSEGTERRKLIASIRRQWEQ